MRSKYATQGASAFTRGIFAALPEEEWKSATGLQPPITYDRKSVIFSEGDDSPHLYLVHSGLVKTFKKPSHDRVQITSILGEGDVLGSESLSKEAYQESATALTRCTLYKCDRDFFLDFMNRKPSVSLSMIRVLNNEFARVQSHIVDLGTRKAIARVASSLMMFKEKQLGERALEPFNLPISRQEMGMFLGLSPETVSRQLKSLTDARVIRLEHKRLTVLDLERLERIAHG